MKIWTCLILLSFSLLITTLQCFQRTMASKPSSRLRDMVKNTIWQWTTRADWQTVDKLIAFGVVWTMFGQWGTLFAWGLRVNRHVELCICIFLRHARQTLSSNEQNKLLMEGDLMTYVSFKKYILLLWMSNGWGGNYCVGYMSTQAGYSIFVVSSVLSGKYMAAREAALCDITSFNSAWERCLHVCNMNSPPGSQAS